MASMVANHQKSLKNHQKKEADFHLIKLTVPPSKKSKKLEFLLEGKNSSYNIFLHLSGKNFNFILFSPPDSNKSSEAATSPDKNGPLSPISSNSQSPQTSQRRKKIQPARRLPEDQIKTVKVEL